MAVLFLYWLVPRRGFLPTEPSPTSAKLGPDGYLPPTLSAPPSPGELAHDRADNVPDPSPAQAMMELALECQAQSFLPSAYRIGSERGSGKVLEACCVWQT